MISIHDPDIIRFITFIKFGIIKYFFFLLLGSLYLKAVLAVSYELINNLLQHDIG